MTVASFYRKETQASSDQFLPQDAAHVVANLRSDWLIAVNALAQSSVSCLERTTAAKDRQPHLAFLLGLVDFERVVENVLGTG